MFTYDCKCHYLISHGVFYDYLFFLSFWLFLYFIVAWIFFSFEICFVLYCPLFFFPNSPTDLWNNNFLNTQTLPSNLSVPFFFPDLSPTMLYPSVPIWTDYCCLLGASFLLLSCAGFPISWIICSFFWSTHSYNMMVKLYGPWMSANMFILPFLYLQLIE